MSNPMESTSVMSKLAWRAKWRRRLQQWKTVIFIALLLVVGVPTAAILTPYGPQYVRDYILKENPTDQAVKPWATKWMYRIGYLYDVTMRSDEAMDCYQTLADWYFKEKAMEIEPGDKWVGYALFRNAQILQLVKLKKMQAVQWYRDYMDNFSQDTNPDYDSDPMFDQVAKGQIAVYDGKL
jgi:hypothetical protein